MVKVKIDQIKADLETAVYVERLMPPVRPPKYRCCMPDVIYTPQEIAFMDRRSVPPHPTQEQIAIWEKVVLQWMPILEVDERKLVWKYSSRIPIKLLCREFCCGRTQIWKRFHYALAKIYYFDLGKKCCEQKRRGHFRKKQL